MIKSLFFFDMAFWFYLITALLYISTLITRREWLGRSAMVMLVVSLVANVMVLVFRTVESGHAPFSNLFESMVFFVLITGVSYMYLEIKYKVKTTGAVVISILFLAMLAASQLTFRFKNPEPLNPALQSIWFEFHVFSAFIGYAGFGLAFALGFLYLIKARFEGRDKKNFIIDRFPDSKVLDELSYTTIAWGFVFFTGGALILGAVWANKAWGTYWSWDPKETWSLITWFIYAAYLHARVTRGWRGKKAAYIAIIGFISTIFLYWGVSFVLPGLHAYG